MMQATLAYTHHVHGVVATNMVSVTKLDFYYVYANLKDHSMWKATSFDNENTQKRNIAQNCGFMKSSI